MRKAHFIYSPWFWLLLTGLVSSLVFAPQILAQSSSNVKVITAPDLVLPGKGLLPGQSAKPQQSAPAQPSTPQASEAKPKTQSAPDAAKTVSLNFKLQGKKPKPLKTQFSAPATKIKNVTFKLIGKKPKPLKTQFSAPATKSKNVTFKLIGKKPQPIKGTAKPGSRTFNLRDINLVVKAKPVVVQGTTSQGAQNLGGQTGQGVGTELGKQNSTQSSGNIGGQTEQGLGQQLGTGGGNRGGLDQKLIEPGALTLMVKSSSNLKKNIDLGSFKLIPKDQPIKKTYDLGSFKLIPKAPVKKTHDLGAFKLVPKKPAAAVTKSVRLSDIVIWGKGRAPKGPTLSTPQLIAPEQVSVNAPNLVLTSKNAKTDPERKSVTAPNLVLTSKNAKTAPERKSVTAPNLVLTSKNARRGPADKVTLKAPNLVLTGKKADGPERKIVSAPNLVLTGKTAEENKVSINGGSLRAVGDRPGRTNVTRPGSLPGRVKVSLLRVRKLSGTTNPFDPVEVEADIEAAKNGTLDAGPLTAAEVPTGFSSFGYGVEIRAGSNFLGQFTPGNPADPNQVFEVLADTPTNTIQYLFGGGSFALISHNAPVTVFAGFHYESTPNTAVTFVVRRVSDNRFFQITVTVAAAGFSDANITQLSGFDCGKSVSGCP